MADFEKVKEGLECCTHPAPFTSCIKCQYKGSPDDCPHCFERLAKDALELVEEQNERIKALEAGRAILVRDISYHNCNNCKRVCEYKPKPGETVRSNCILWEPKDGEQE